MENFERSRGDGAEICFVLFGGFKTKNMFHIVSPNNRFHMVSQTNIGFLCSKVTGNKCKEMDTSDLSGFGDLFHLRTKLFSQLPARPG